MLCFLMGRPKEVEHLNTLTHKGIYDEEWIWNRYFVASYQANERS